jgi:hypothetical protein
MTYDQWKCQDPNEPYGDYDEDYDPERDCEHEHYEIDICTGRAECDYCPHSWYMTSKEIDAEIDRQARYQEDMKRENRRQWWRDKTYPARMFVFRILERIWPRKALSVLDDSEIPF